MDERSSLKLKWRKKMRLKKTLPCKLILFFLAFALALPLGPMSALAAAKINHTPPSENYIPGFRINLDVEIQDSADLLAARCYFKTKQDDNFAFTDLFSKGDGQYQAVLPAPWINSEAVEYLFVTVNQDKKVTRSPLFVIEEGETEEAATWKDASEVEQVRLDKAQEAIEDYEAIRRQLQANNRGRLPQYQSGQSTDTLTIQTELSKEAVPLNGFYDKAIVTEVADSAKYGFMAKGLYTAEQIAAAEAAGVPTASAGMSTLTKVGIGVLAVGAGVGVAAAVDDDSSSSSSSGGGGGGGGGGTTDLTAETILGSWSFSGQRRDGVDRSGTIEFRSNGTQTFTVTDADGQSDGSGSGTWQLADSTLTVDFSGQMSTWVGTVTGTSTSFTLDTTSGTNHGVYNFTR
jgi:hypothetical protein